MCRKSSKDQVHGTSGHVYPLKRTRLPTDPFTDSGFFKDMQLDRKSAVLLKASSRPKSSLARKQASVT